MRSTGMVVALSSMIVALTACGSSDGNTPDEVEDLPDGGPTDFRLSGTVSGAARRPGDFNVLFINEDNIGSIHVYGLGRSTDGETFSLYLPAMAPDGTRNGGTTAVGSVLMTELNDSIEPGQATTADGEKVIGISTDHMVVFRLAPNVSQYPWEDDFPTGWSCATCQRSQTGTADLLVERDCSTLNVDIGDFDSLDVCDPFRQ